MTAQTDTRQLYLDAIGEYHRREAHSAPAWLRGLRSAGAERFADLGFPTTRTEEWKYTDTSAIERAAFAPMRAGANGMDAAQLNAQPLMDLPAHRLVFVNGGFAPALSAPGALPLGMTAGSLADALRDEPDEIEPHLGRHADRDGHAFAALNSALLGDGAYVRIPAGIEARLPVHIVHVVTAAAEETLCHPRNLIVAEPGSTAVVIEHFIGIGVRRYFTDSVTEVVADADARIEHYRLQTESIEAYHVNGLHLHLGHNSRFTAHGIDLGGRLVRNDLHALLDAEDTHCTLNGLYVGDGRQHLDNHTRIDHARPRGTSREYYKGILDGRARAVFHGRIVVHPNAQQSDAQQVNNNLLLSRDAEADTQPQLEIYADDVKCAHGATVGQLDEDALFYLRSRGLGEPTARDLLTYAFARDVLARIGLEPIRTELERRLAAGLLHGRSVEGLT